VLEDGGVLERAEVLRGLRRPAEPQEPFGAQDLDLHQILLGERMLGRDAQQGVHVRLRSGHQDDRVTVKGKTEPRIPQFLDGAVGTSKPKSWTPQPSTCPPHMLRFPAVGHPIFAKTASQSLATVRVTVRLAVR
jgi:hypothetical protein